MHVEQHYFTAYHRPVWAEIDVDSVRHNIREFQRILPSSTQIMAVVKADAYGHGAYHVAKAALQAGANDYLDKPILSHDLRAVVQAQLDAVNGDGLNH